MRPHNDRCTSALFFPGRARVGRRDSRQGFFICHSTAVVSPGRQGSSSDIRAHATLARYPYFRHGYALRACIANDPARAMVLAVGSAVVKAINNNCRQAQPRLLGRRLPAPLGRCAGLDQGGEVLPLAAMLVQRLRFVVVAALLAAPAAAHAAPVPLVRCPPWAPAPAHVWKWASGLVLWAIPAQLPYSSASGRRRGREPGCSQGASGGLLGRRT